MNLGYQIENQLSLTLPLYTSEYSNTIGITTLTASTGLISATTSSNHGIITGNKVLIQNAIEPIPITSLSRVGNIGTVTTSVYHGMRLKYKPEYVGAVKMKISGVLPIEWNGEFEILQILDDYTIKFRILSNPTAALTFGNLYANKVLYPNNDYNGVKTITVTSPNSFTYTTDNLTLNSPAAGDILLVKGSRVIHTVDYATILDIIRPDCENNNLKPSLFIVFGGDTNLKDGSLVSDANNEHRGNGYFYFKNTIDFTIYVVLPSKNSRFGGDLFDKAYNLKPILYKILVGFVADNNMVSGKYLPIIPTGSKFIEYNAVYYIYGYNFIINGEIFNEDILVSQINYEKLNIITQNTLHNANSIVNYTTL